MVKYQSTLIKDLKADCQDLRAERDNLTARTIVAEAECEILKARIKGLEGEWPKWKFACYPAPKPKPRAQVRCIDCEHLDMGSVKDDKGLCPYHYRGVPRLDIYCKWACINGHFTPAALGCGSPEQAMRAELRRLADEKGAK